MSIKDTLRRLVRHQDAPPPVTVAVAPTESAAVRDERVRVGTRAANAGLSADPALSACPNGTDEEKLAALAEIDALVDRVVAVDIDAGGVDALSSDMQATRRVFRSPTWTAEDVETYAALSRHDRREPVRSTQPSGEVAEAPEPEDDAVAKSRVLEDLPATHQAVLEDLVPHLSAEELDFLAGLSEEDLEKAAELARELDDDEVTELSENAEDVSVKTASGDDLPG